MKTTLKRNSTVISLRVARDHLQKELQASLLTIYSLWNIICQTSQSNRKELLRKYHDQSLEVCKASTEAVVIQKYWLKIVDLKNCIPPRSMFLC